MGLLSTTEIVVRGSSSGDQQFEMLKACAWPQTRMSVEQRVSEAVRTQEIGRREEISREIGAEGYSPSPSKI